MKRLDVALKMRDIGVIPLYYNPDLEVMKEVVSACYNGGMKIFEFTNRGVHSTGCQIHCFTLAERRYGTYLQPQESFVDSRMRHSK